MNSGAEFSAAIFFGFFLETLIPDLISGDAQIAGHWAGQADDLEFACH
jgi:hypothetical protein